MHYVRQDFPSLPFLLRLAGVRFIGCGAGPSLRMGPPHIPREEILWLDSIVRATPAEQPIIFINHFPIDQGLSNWYEVVDILKTRNIQAILGGHLHVNRAYDAEGIPAVIGRSSLRRKDPIGGYNLVTLRGNTLEFHERIIKAETPCMEYDPSGTFAGEEGYYLLSSGFRYQCYLSFGTRNLEIEGCDRYRFAGKHRR